MLPLPLLLLVLYIPNTTHFPKLFKLLNKIKNTYIFHIDISVINFSLIFELNKYSNLIRYNDYSVVFNENGDGGLTLPQDCHIIIACYILQGWKTISIFHYSQDYGFHSPELKSETCEVRLIYC